MFQRIFENYRSFLNERKVDKEYEAIAEAYIDALLQTANEIKETNDRLISTKYFKKIGHSPGFLRRIFGVESADEGNYFFIPNEELGDKIVQDYLNKIPEQERTLITDIEEEYAFKDKFIFTLFLHPRMKNVELGGMSGENIYIHISYYPDKEAMDTTNPWIYLKEQVLPQLKKEIKSVFVHELTHAIDNIRSFDKDEDEYKDIYQFGPKSMRAGKYTQKQLYGSGYGELNARSVEAKHFIKEKINSLYQVLVGLVPNDSKEEYLKAIKDLDKDKIDSAIKDSKDIRTQKLLMYAKERLVPDYIDQIMGIVSSIQTNNTRMFIDSVGDIEELTYWNTLPKGSKAEKEFRQKAVGRLLDVFEDLREEYKENPEISSVLQMINKIQGIS
jgi:hypothetical protein